VSLRLNQAEKRLPLTPLVRQKSVTLSAFVYSLACRALRYYQA
jgi:hypothetical protein